MSRRKDLIVFQASAEFWALLHPSDLHERRRLLREIIVCWDGQMRPFPQEWRGSQELSLRTDGVLQRWSRDLKEKGLTRVAAVFSAALQAGYRAPAPKPENAPPAAASVALPIDVAAPGPEEQEIESGEPPPEEKIGVFRLDATPYTEEQAAILLGKIRALRAQAIRALRDRRAWALDLEEARGDEADVALGVQRRQDEEREIARARQLLVETDQALQRLRDGSYGWCEETGEVIDYRRMLANPLARLSLEAQERLEARRRLAA